MDPAAEENGQDQEHNQAGEAARTQNALKPGHARSHQRQLHCLIEEIPLLGRI